MQIISYDMEKKLKKLHGFGEKRFLLLSTFLFIENKYT